MGITNKNFVVIGLGRFGINIADTLMHKGAHVIAIDRDPKIIEEIKDRFTTVIAADSTDIKALQGLGIDDVDTAVIAIGEDIKTNILTTAIIKKLGIKRIIARATDLTHSEILTEIGATKVISPEIEMGKNLGASLVTDNMLDSIQFSDDYVFAQNKTPKSFVAKTIIEANVRVNYNINIVAIKKYRSGKEETYFPDAKYRFEAEDILCVVGKISDVDEFGKLPTCNL